MQTDHGISQREGSNLYRLSDLPSINPVYHKLIRTWRSETKGVWHYSELFSNTFSCALTTANCSKHSRTSQCQYQCQCPLSLVQLSLTPWDSQMLVAIELGSIRSSIRKKLRSMKILFGVPAKLLITHTHTHTHTHTQAKIKETRILCYSRTFSWSRPKTRLSNKNMGGGGMPACVCLCVRNVSWTTP